MAQSRLTLTESAAFLGISRPTMLALIKRNQIKFEKDPLDQRKKLIDKSELQKLKEKSQ